jgi:hypothetical protein
MLRFVRLQRPLAGLVITYGTIVVARWFAFRGIVPLLGILYMLFAFISSLVALYTLPIGPSFGSSAQGYCEFTCISSGIGDSAVPL